METDDIVDLKKPCAVCGISKAVIKAGFQYCIECGTQCDANPLMEYTQSYNPSINKIIATRLKSKNLKLGEMWSTWHAHNLILLGLTEEVANLGVSEKELKVTTFQLFAKFLKINKIAFFEKNFSARPRLPFGFTDRDLEFLYDIRKIKNRKRKIKNEEMNTQNMGHIEMKRCIAKKKAMLIHQEYQKLIDSQVSTCPVVSQTLADLKEVPQSKPSTISFTSRTIKLLSLKLSHATIANHMKDGLCRPGCRCLQYKTDRIWQRKNKLGITNLYAILILSLRIIGNEIQVGDILRWCREGHISYGVYDHFFPEDMILKKIDKKFVIYKASLSHVGMRNTINMIAKYLKLDDIAPPDIASLIRRYVVELELPSELYNFTIRIISMIEPLPCYIPKKNGTLPNYEGIAMSYIIVCLKILFGLDDNVENDISNSVEEINNHLSFQRERKSFPSDLYSFHENKNPPGKRRLFVWKDWMRYIEYRKMCISEYHYPTRIQADFDDCDMPNLFLHQNQIDKKDKTEEYKTKNMTNMFIKSVLNRVDDAYDSKKESFPKFDCSLYPLTSAVENLLTRNFFPSRPKFNKDILEEDFSCYNLSYILSPKMTQRSLKKLGVDLQIINERNIHIDPKLTEPKKKKGLMSNGNTVEVLDCSLSKWMNILETERVHQAIEEIEHRKILEDKIITFTITPNDCIEIKDKIKKRIKLTSCYKKYWLRHYYNYLLTFSKSTFDLELDNYFPKSFAWLLKQCAITCEMENNLLYFEVCRLEKKLIKNGIFKANYM
ncbi:TATA box-binding protein-associated factor RNA polymerase I subunit B [Arctopsyche grandis]|uniref:TATA box-binding protein-associated factor RNA polymerase I subunit B n=1 Tax=Arctopsyche grandis TaxID=121162 RepID=UPI00406D8B0A